MQFSLKNRLIIMNFLQFFAWGAWLLSTGAYLGGNLKFSGIQIGAVYGTMGIASLFMPAIVGIIAGVFCIPRCGDGARKGESVSTSHWLCGTSLTASRKAGA